MSEASRRREELRAALRRIVDLALEHGVDVLTVGGDLYEHDRVTLDTVRKNVTIDWTMRETVQAQLRVLVKRILRKHGYPPDKQEKATRTVLEQAEQLSWEMAA